MMHPLRQEFIKEYKSMGNNKEDLKDIINKKRKIER